MSLRSSVSVYTGAGAGLSVLSACVLLLFSAQAFTNTQVDEHREKLRQLRQQIQQTQQTIRQAEGEMGGVQQTLMQAEKEISHIGRRLHIIRKDYALQQKHHEKLQVAVEERQNGLDVEQQKLGALLRSAFLMDRHGDIRLLLNQQSPALFSRMISYHEYFNRQRIAQIDRVNKKLADLAAARHELNLQTSALQRLKSKREQQLARLERFKEQKQGVLARIVDSIKDDSGLLSQLRKDEQSLKDILKSLTDLLSDIPLGVDRKKTFSSLRGKLLWPSSGQLTTRFGSQRGTTGKTWSGVVIGAERGQDVKAVARGRVAFSDWLRGYGLLVIIDHGDDYMSLYGHNESVFKDTGEWVEAGDIIASVGDSGGQTQSGLYFEIRKGGKPLNPVRWCSGKVPPRHG